MNQPVNLDELINRVLDDLDVPDISNHIDRMYRYAFDAERSIGSRGIALPRKECLIDIIDYRGILPKDFFQLEAIKYGDAICQTTNRDFRLFHETSPNLAQPFNFASTNTNLNILAQTPSSIKFSVNGRYIDVTLQNGQIGLAYYSMPIDIDGKVVVPERHAKAVSIYMQWQWLRPRYYAGKLSGEAYREIKAEWQQARNEVKVEDDSPTLPEMDMVAGMMLNQTFWPNRNTF